MKRIRKQCSSTSKAISKAIFRNSVVTENDRILLNPVKIFQNNNAKNAVIHYRFARFCQFITATGPSKMNYKAVLSNRINRKSGFDPKGIQNPIHQKTFS